MTGKVHLCPPVTNQAKDVKTEKYKYVCSGNFSVYDTLITVIDKSRVVVNESDFISQSSVLS